MFMKHSLCTHFGIKPSAAKRKSQFYYNKPFPSSHSNFIIEIIKIENILAEILKVRNYICLKGKY